MCILYVFLSAYQWPSGLICLFERKWNERSIEHTDWRFFPHFMQICVPSQRNATSLYPLQNHAPFFAAILRSFGAGRQNSKNLAYEFGLHVFVQFYPDPLRFAGVISKTPILSKHIGLFTWQRTINNSTWYNRMSASATHCRLAIQSRLQ